MFHIVVDAELIRRRAFDVWEARGRPLGDDWRDWFAAERAIRAENLPWIQRLVAKRAAELWQDRRCPDGQDDAIWLEAEHQVCGNGIVFVVQRLEDGTVAPCKMGSENSDRVSATQTKAG